MAHRRISSSKKGKGIDLGPHQPLRAARIKAPEPDTSDLLCKHSLTLIERVTNKSVQKVWSLIPFFTEHWKTKFKPVGSDLGNGLFQFQFELEPDLLAVLKQRPYHYARWMIILQRWEPTVSPSFPSLILFWIKVQGLPVHLWTEETIKCIGQDIGTYEKAEITTLNARMRVHIDGLLPLIKESVVEFPNGDEVYTTLVYERLDKHCTKCLRLDHEIKECLVARAEAKALKAAQEEASDRTNITSSLGAGSIKGKQANSVSEMRAPRDGQNRSHEAFQFSASNNERLRENRPPKEARESSQHRAYKSQSMSWQERSLHRRSYQARERTRQDYERPSRPMREQVSHQYPPGPPGRSYYREVPKRITETRLSDSSA